MKLMIEPSMDSMVYRCVAPLATAARICERPALYLCSNGHTLCKSHAPRIGGDNRRRKTDVKCKICMDLKLRSVITMANPLPVSIERRASR
ncbi:MAG TPA: hypothetical protein VIG51_06450 [Candidatus Baltobacteraceae bacterium]|jgi:hypothetical protein